MINNSNFINKTPNWKRLLEILKQRPNQAFPTTTLSLLCGLSQDKVDRALSQTAKFGYCRKVTKKSVNYWKWTGD